MNRMGPYPGTLVMPSQKLISTMLWYAFGTPLISCWTSSPQPSGIRGWMSTMSSPGYAPTSAFMSCAPRAFAWARTAASVWVFPAKFQSHVPLVPDLPV